MRITFGLTAMAARHSLNRDYAGLNKATNALLSDVGIARAGSNPNGAMLSVMVALDAAALTDAMTHATDTITKIQTTETALDSIVAKLTSMRALVQEVQTVDHSEEEIAAYAASYEALAAEVVTLLDDTTHDGSPLLSGRDPLVPLQLNSQYVTDLDLTAAPDDALQSISLAISEITMAKVDLQQQSQATTSSMTDLQNQSNKLTSFGARLVTAQAALDVLADITSLLTSRVLGLSTQANVSPTLTASLLS